MKILLCIDDTDDLVKGKGTGDLAEAIAAMIQKEGWGTCKKITRHQLLIHEEIPYTSHNSSMCFEAEIDEQDYQAIIDGAAAYLEREHAEGSDPGLCVVAVDKLSQPNSLMEFGKRAKKEVLHKEQAYKLAQSLQVHLSEHGGTGQGIIGALAGTGLRLSGNDGEFKGPLDFGNADEVYTVADLCKHEAVDLVMDIDKHILAEDTKIVMKVKTKTILLDGKSVLLVAECKDRGNEKVYVVCNKEQIRKFGMFRKNEKGQREFCGGLDDSGLAAKIAGMCKNFAEDVEEEMVTEDERSCFNCRLRRWTANTFICCSQE